MWLYEEAVCYFQTLEQMLPVGYKAAKFDVLGLHILVVWSIPISVH